MGIHLNSELERRIAEKVESGRYKSVDEVVEKGLELLEQREDQKGPTVETPAVASTAGLSVWEIAAEIVGRIPEADAASLPPDLAVNHDHYLYGSPKVYE